MGFSPRGPLKADLRDAIQELLRIFAARSTTLFHLGNCRRIRRTPKRKTVQKLKIAWRLCYSRKPFRKHCSRMRTPDKGSNGGLLNLMPRAPARIQRIAQTRLHLSSTCLLYQSERHRASTESKKLSALWSGHSCPLLLLLSLLGGAILSRRRLSSPI
jgi:hypothetical protein